MIRKHIRHVPDDKNNDRRAIAPYNFIELPDQVVKAQLEENGKLRDNDSYYLDRHTGRIECTLTTSSPLYTRCGLTQAQFNFYQKQLREGKEVPDYPEFFYIDPDTKLPVISGSSLRGMVRNLVEIISFSKIDKVSEHQKFFFRAVAADKDDPLKHKYKLHNVQAGYLELKENTQQWFIRPACEINKNKKLSYIRVKENEIDKDKIPSLILMKKDGYLPQYIKVSFKIDGRSVLISENTQDYPKNQGWLITSGNMLETSNLTESEREAKLKSKEGRKYHYIVPIETSGDSLEISPDAISDYKAALTNFQNGKFFKDHPKNSFHEDKGILEDGRPIFYCQLKPGQAVKFFGQSPNFRIPYIPKGKTRAASAVDFIPENLKDISIIDLADAIFGWIRREDKENQLPEGIEKQRAGRVFISEAKYKADKNGIWYKGNQDNTVTPQILASPKPTTFQHYLVQPKETKAEKKNLKHYASKPVEETVIRGHKLYWHKGSDPTFEHPNPDNASDTQTTKIKPINKDVTFEFTIDFENLSDVELGALMWVLDIAQDDNYRLKLGMGKPLGMGAVKIEPKLYLSDRTKRYTKLFESNNWETAETLEDDPDYKEFFENYMLEQLQQTGKLKEIPRIRMLLEMLRWEENPSQEYLEQRRYMEIERKQRPRLGSDDNEYKERRVLPTPLQVMGIELECDRSSSPPKNSQHSGSHRHLGEITRKQPSQQFSEGQEVDAKVVDIQEEEIQKGNKKQLKTMITYKIEGSDCLSKEVVDKQKVSLAIGDVVKVNIVKVQETNIRKVKRVESN